MRWHARRQELGLRSRGTRLRLATEILLPNNMVGWYFFPVGRFQQSGGETSATLLAAAIP